MDYCHRSFFWLGILLLRVLYFHWHIQCSYLYMSFVNHASLNRGRGYDFGELENQDMLGGSIWPPSKSHVWCPNMTNDTPLESSCALPLESAFYHLSFYLILVPGAGGNFLFTLSNPCPGGRGGYFFHFTSLITLN